MSICACVHVCACSLPQGPLGKFKLFVHKPILCLIVGIRRQLQQVFVEGQQCSGVSATPPFHGLISEGTGGSLLAEGEATALAGTAGVSPTVSRRPGPLRRERNTQVQGSWGGREPGNTPRFDL